MKFLLNSHISWPEGAQPAELYQDAIDEVRLAEELGFASAWLAGHHFSRFGLAPSQLMIFAKMAGLTKTIRFGTAEMIPPLESPIRIAEDAAMLDQLSDGRLDLGVGRGSAAYEYTGFDIDREESHGRFHESIEVMKGLWTQPELCYDGDFYKIDHVSLVPPPLQKPHPPIYIALVRTPETLALAAETGHPVMIGTTQDLTPAYDLCRRWEEGAREAGHSDASMADVPFFRHVYVARTEEEALRDAHPAMDWMIDMLEWRRTFSVGSEVHGSLDVFRKQRGGPAGISFQHVLDNRAVFGTPEQCVRKIKEMETDGVGQLGCNFAFGGIAHTKVMKSMELFAREVMPHFT